MDLHRAIVSSIPGRLRLRHPSLRGCAQRSAVSACVSALPGVLSVDANPQTGSLLVRYDATRCERAAMEAQLAGLFPAVPDALPGEAENSANSRRAVAREWNRVAKLGMMASLPLSLVLAAAGSKKTHALTGGVFTALLLVHLVVHRRHLIK